VERAQAGANVVIISSGDAGVYGMGGLVFQVLQEIGWTRGASPELRLIPGITALNACASLVGAPLGHDFCTISLSDLLTPWPVIERRLQAAAWGDFVIGFYNPRSQKRSWQLRRALDILLSYRAGTTPVAVVRNVTRPDEEISLTTLAALEPERVD